MDQMSRVYSAVSVLSSKHKEAQEKLLSSYRQEENTGNKMVPYQNFGTYVDRFPRRGFLCLAGFQVAAALLFITMASVDLGINVHRMMHPKPYLPMYPMDEVIEPDDPMNWPDYPGEDKVEVMDEPEFMEDRSWDYYDDYVDITPYLPGGDVAIIILSGLYLIAGGLGLGAARTPTAHRRAGLKNGFMVFGIINALSPGLLLFAVGGSLNVWNAIYPGHFYAWRHVFGGTVAVLGLALWVLSIVSAAVSCCCAPVEEVKYVMLPQTLPGLQDEKKNSSVA